MLPKSEASTRLNWSAWTYDLFRSVIRSMGIAGCVWGGYELKYGEINWNDLWLALLVGGGLRALLGFLSEHPLPEDMDAKPPEDSTAKGL